MRCNIGRNGVWNLRIKPWKSKVKLTTCFLEFSKYESTNYFYKMLCNICYDLLKTEKIMPFLTNKEFVFFLNRETLVKNSYSENSWKHVNSIKGRLMDQPTLYFGNNYKEQINRGGDSFITVVFLTSLIFYLKPNSILRFCKKIWNFILLLSSWFLYKNIKIWCLFKDDVNQALK